jgi:hypothetical protein
LNGPDRLPVPIMSSNPPAQNPQVNRLDGVFDTHRLTDLAQEE